MFTAWARFGGRIAEGKAPAKPAPKAAEAKATEAKTTEAKAANIKTQDVEYKGWAGCPPWPACLG